MLRRRSFAVLAGLVVSLSLINAAPALAQESPLSEVLLNVVADALAVNQAAIQSIYPGAKIDPAILASAVPAGIMASSNGSASVAPIPRKKVRRGMHFLLIIIVFSS